MIGQNILNKNFTLSIIIFCMRYSGKLSPLDKYIILAVKRKREEQGIAQADLSVRMELNDKFVGNVESSRQKAKYNMNHLNKIAEILNCSLADFFPMPYMKNNDIE